MTNEDTEETVKVTTPFMGDKLPDKVRVYKVLSKWAYQGVNIDQLSFPVGAEIEVIIQDIEEAPGWWIGKYESNQGLFPANYVSVIEIYKPKEKKLFKINQKRVSTKIKDIQGLLAKKSTSFAVKKSEVEKSDETSQKPEQNLQQASNSNNVQPATNTSEQQQQPPQQEESTTSSRLLSAAQRRRAMRKKFFSVVNFESGTVTQESAEQKVKESKSSESESDNESDNESTEESQEDSSDDERISTDGSEDEEESESSVDSESEKQEEDDEGEDKEVESSDAEKSELSEHEKEEDKVEPVDEQKNILESVVPQNNESSSSQETQPLEYPKPSAIPGKAHPDRPNHVNSPIRSPDPIPTVVPNTDDLRQLQTIKEPSQEEEVEESVEESVIPVGRSIFWKCFQNCNLL